MPVRIGELLLKEKRITPEQLQEALNYQRQNGGKLGFNLIKLGYVKDEEITARVDLKSDRKDGVLRVAAAWVEPGCVPGRTAEELAQQLRRAADWQGLGEVVVDDRGDLARELKAQL